MKKLIMTVVGLTLLATPLFAAEKSIDLQLAEIQAERKAIVEAAVEPNDGQGEQFWNIYWEYRGKVGRLTDRTVEVIKEFGSADASLSAVRAWTLIEEVIDIEKQRTALKQSYVQSYREILTAKQIARWYQVERKMDSVLRASMALTIPFDSFTAKPVDEITPTKLKDSREEIVNEIVQPSAGQEKAFWKAYRKYVEKNTKLDDSFTDLVDEFIKSYGSMTEKQAQKMTKKAAKIDTDRVKSLESVIKKTKSVLNQNQRARLMQGELKMNALVDFGLAAAIPLVL